jgi:hypothetical protein
MNALESLGDPERLPAKSDWFFMLKVNKHEPAAVFDRAHSSLRAPQSNRPV